ncbi:MAG: hypothetical protein IT429_26640 [Gemmataceae bacterium]|nr:hypothetical protein [Gemmataceae bacterium]
MDCNPATRRRRETVALIGMTAFCGSIIFFFGMLILGGLFPALLLVVGVMTLLGAAHYFIWGRTYARQTASGTKHGRGDAV